jgi:hypothetical protein
VSAGRLLRAILWSAAAIVLLGLAACSDDNNPVSTTTVVAPVLPDMSTMTMDLSFFGITGDGLLRSRSDTGVAGVSATRRNWIEAVVRALHIQLLFYDGFREPIAAFAAALSATPQPQPDESWLWTFIFVEEETEYSIFLYGQVEDDHVNWRMEVSSNDPTFMLDHFVWFDGQSQRDETSGYWQFYTPVITPPTSARLYMVASTPGVQSVRMDWAKPTQGQQSLVVTVNEVGGADEGDVLSLTTSPNGSAIDYHNEDVQQDHNITWYPDGSGSITVPDYNDGQKACWDTDQEDAPCP